MKEIEVAERYQRMQKVIDLHLEGKRDTAIAKALNMKRTEVLAYIDEFKELARNDDVLRERSREVVVEFDQQQNRIIEEFWDIINSTADEKVKAGALKSLADVTAKRVEVMQKSGLLNDAALGDELAEMEEKQAILIKILREVVCDQCKPAVMAELAKVTKQAEIIVIQEADPKGV